MEEADVRVADFYSKLTDEELDNAVRELQRIFPNSGYRMMQGYLQGRGIRVQEQNETVDETHRPSRVA
ncbi:hypothetical protein SKAU_G00095040 [Synaphobranchus kaupii]|uniref:Uncharacterized protein n=1 Tax=Synaphobranchus kaupii TaxID=118154 RepID=A0A9Q1FXG9_SYNKA|nr:hypothetical protein SKAU_G00095040 [Synaphobranchus kaupii]